MNIYISPRVCDSWENFFNETHLHLIEIRNQNFLLVCVIYVYSLPFHALLLWCKSYSDNFFFFHFWAISRRLRESTIPPTGEPSSVALPHSRLAFSPFKIVMLKYFQGILCYRLRLQSRRLVVVFIDGEKSPKIS